MIPFTEVGSSSPQRVAQFPGFGSRLFSGECELSTGCLRSFSALAGSYDALHTPSAFGFPAVVSCNLQLSAGITPLSCRPHFFLFVFLRVFLPQKMKKKLGYSGSPFVLKIIF